MKKLLIPALLLAASTAGAQKGLVPDPAFARLPGTVLRIADSTRIDAIAAKLETPITVFAGTKGGIVVYSQWRAVTAFDSLGRRIWGQGGSRDRRDIGDVTAFGWRGNEMWVSDASMAQVALLDSYGNVTRSLEVPSWARPTFSNRKSFPVFESMRVLALYQDGTMLILPRSPLSVTGASTYDENSSYILKINEDGIIQRTVAKFPTNILTVTEKNGDKFSFANPLNQSLYRVAPDGMRTVTVAVDTMNPKVDSVVLRSVNERGDTMFVQKFSYPAMAYSDMQADSIARTRWGNDTEYRERRAKVMPRRAQAVHEFVLDVDKSVWLTLRGNGSTRPVIGFDPTGKVIGKFLVPARRAVKAANNGALWVGEIRSDIRGDLVRYRLKQR